jgi:hypothetical protein
MLDSQELEVFLGATMPSDSGATTAFWLDNYYSNEWVITVGKVTKVINWQVKLPNSSYLTDPQNTYIYQISKRFIFELMNLNVFGNTRSCECLKSYFRWLIKIIHWLFVHENEYKPCEYAFQKLDEDAIKFIISSYVMKRTDGILCLEERFVKVCVEILDNSNLDVEQQGGAIPNILVNPPLDSVSNQFNSEQLTILKSWFYKNGFYDKNPVLRKISDMVFCLDRSKIASLLNLEGKLNFSASFILFLRQFEACDDYEKYEYVTKFPSREYLPEDYQLIENRAITPATVASVQPLLNLFDAFVTLSDYISGLPSNSWLSETVLTKIAVNYGAGGDKHHRNIPPQIALQLLESSITYIHNFGKHIHQECRLISREIIEKDNNKVVTLPKLATGVSKEPLSLLNIVTLRSCWGKSKNKNSGKLITSNYCRSYMSFEDALIFLFAATFIITAIMSARRKSELLALKGDCVKGTLNNYWLEFYAMKSGEGGNRIRLKRPIPNFVAESIMNLVSINKLFYSCNNMSDSDVYVFSFPYHLAIRHEIKAKANLSFDWVNRYCDYINLPVSLNKRRWYPKFHEFRRFFAIAFFWQFKYSNILTLSWMLGHDSVDKTYTYIRDIIGAESMSKEEAKFSSQAVLSHEECEGLEGLRKLIRCYFKTENLELIELDDLEDYLNDLATKGRLKVKPYTVETLDGVEYKILFEVEG